MNEKPIAYYTLTAFNAVEILGIDYTDDTVIFRWNNSGKYTKRKKAKIRYTYPGENGKAYFKTYNLKICLDECLRTGI